MTSRGATSDGRIEFPAWTDGIEPMAACLRAAWPPPRLDQSPTYLRWCGRDDPHAALALASDASGRVFGSVGLVPRRFRIGCDHEAQEGWLLSFAAVDPSRRGEGWAGRLYDALLNRVASEARVSRRPLRPILGFAPVATSGEHLLRSRVVRAGYSAHDLGCLQTHVRLTRPEDAPPRLDSAVWTLVPGDSQEQTHSSTDWVNEYHTLIYRGGSLGSESLLTEADDPVAWLAWANDPRGRVVVIHRRHDGRLDWAAGFVWAVVAEADQVRRVLQVERVVITPDRPPIWAELAELGDYLAANGCGSRGEPRFDPKAPPPILSIAFDPTRPATASGPWTDPRSARFRAVGAAFRAIWFTPTCESSTPNRMNPTWTHLEII